MSTLLLYGDNAMDPPALSALIVGLLDLSLLGAWLYCVWQSQAAKREAKIADLAVDPNAPLHEAARFVAGTVEFGAQQPFALRVTIDQVGSEKTYKNSTTHTWTETERNTEIHPFYIKHASGQRVRIAPKSNAHVLLVDKLDQRHWVSRDRRRKRAELTQGETVFAEGILRQSHDPESHGTGGTRSYRDTATGWTLEPLHGQLHFSTEPLGHRHRLRAKALGRMAILLPILAFFALLPLLPFHVRAWAGQDVEASYEGAQTWTTRNKNSVKQHYGLHASVSLPGTPTYFERYELDETDYRRLPTPQRGVSESTTQPQRVWVRYVPAAPELSALGQGATASAIHALISSLMCMLLLAQVRHVSNYKRWYARPLNERGQTALPLPSGEVFSP
ncbi:MAG: hypothetical protein Q8Q09_26880 [Deltaproteobacteria bacterium]|nr:hypothetical protein [Deltaproteobacteria bacterium]